MEDRYLFKAKRVDNGEWVEGFLVKPNIKYVNIMENPDEKGELSDVREIDEKTICQCTGLEDKNGKLIWENDIVRFNIYDYEVLKSSIISVVEWCDEIQSLTIVVNKRNQRGTLGHILDSDKELEVIGNKFDNPELLESEE